MKEAMPERYDVLIIGSSQAGVTTTLKLASTALKIAVFNKAQFPRINLWRWADTR